MFCVFKLLPYVRTVMYHCKSMKYMARCKAKLLIAWIYVFFALFINNLTYKSSEAYFFS